MSFAFHRVNARVSATMKWWVERGINSLCGQLQAWQLCFFRSVLLCSKNRQLLPTSLVAKVYVTFYAHLACPMFEPGSQRPAS